MVYFKNLFSIVSFWLPKWNKVEKSELKRRQWRQIATIPNSVKLCYVSCFFSSLVVFVVAIYCTVFGWWKLNTITKLYFEFYLMKLIVFALVRFASLNAEFVGAGENGKTEREREQANWNDTMQVQSEQKAETKCYLIEWLHIKLLLFNQRSRKIKSQNDVFQLFGLWSHLYASRNICITMGLSRW